MTVIQDSSSPSSTPGPAPVPTDYRTRDYQAELLEESLKRNIIIALDTGSGKTWVAILRIRHEITKSDSKKVSWFIAPTVTLIDQQKDVIAASVPVPVAGISGLSEPDKWKDAKLWATVLRDHRVVVSTPQVLLDALSHGYVNLGRDIALIVFDEAHHAVGKHPYNMIMKNFYHTLPPRKDAFTEELMRPTVLGLTASPIYGGNVEKDFMLLERNLDSTICSSKINRHELAKHVHRPLFKHVIYPSPAYSLEGEPPSLNLIALRRVVGGMQIDDDPYVISLRSQLARLPAGEQRNRVDQKLSKTLSSADTFTHKGLRDFERAATDICYEIGPWAADWYITTVIEQARKMATLRTGIMASWQDKEKKYLLEHLAKVDLLPLHGDPAEIRRGLSPKTTILIECLFEEEKDSRTQEEPYSGIVFVTRRDSVLALGEVLSRLPDVKRHFQVGCLLGNSGSFKRHAFLDITRALLKQTATETINDFRTGEKNVIVSTAVAEEGLDIQACGNVIRFDAPPNMVAWAQSRGRARRRRSTFVLMLNKDGLTADKIAQWEEVERAMVERYVGTNDDPEAGAEASDDMYEEGDQIQYRVPETGALLTLDSALSHLYHFCAVLPHSGHGSQLPLFDLDPPDFEERWHSLDPRPPRPLYLGPWGASCTLPRQLPPHLRKFATSCVYSTKRSAINHVAFFTYFALYNEGLLNDNLLPLTSVLDPDEEKEVKLLLEEVEKRAGMERVPIQMDPWAMSRSGSQSWYFNELTIEGLPPLYLYTPTPLPQLVGDELPTLYAPGKGALSVSITSTMLAVDDDTSIMSARLFTRHMFRVLHGRRTDPEKTDFCYLFLPTMEADGEQVWKERRVWMQDRTSKSNLLRFEGETRANADMLARKFGHTLDWAIVRGNDKFDKVVRFLGWHEGPITDEEAEKLHERYDGFPEMQIKFPLVVAQPFPRRANFLVPLETDEAGVSKEAPFLLHPEYTSVDLVSTVDVQYSLLLPSLLRFLSVAITVNTMRANLLASTPLKDLPFALLRTALTAPSTQEPTNYERLETLGDTVLKYLVSIQLFSQYPLWHEGYLARRKDHSVNNQRLAKEAVRLELEKYIIRDMFAPRKWKPRYTTDDLSPKAKAEKAEDAEVAMDTTADGDEPQSPQSPTSKETTRKKKQQSQELSTKLMADVVESLIGASYEHGGFDLALECAKLFGLRMPSWEPISQRVDACLSRVETLDDELPKHFALVEQMLDYKFTHKSLLVEALTHGSYTGELQSVSYERLEFLGDAALDMVVTDFLYHSPGKDGKPYTPGYMHIHKEALVNSHILAYICLRTSVDVDASIPLWREETDTVELTSDSRRVHLFQCLLHSSTRVMEDQIVTFTRFEKVAEQIQTSLDKDKLYPWAALTSLQAPKFISDMVESLLGAVWLDAHGNLDAVRKVLETLGITRIMERIVADEVDDLHPVSRLAIWAAKHERKWEIKNDKIEGDAVCTVKIDDEEVARAVDKFRGKVSVNGTRFAAAEAAIRKLNVVEQEKPMDFDETDWGEVPGYE